MAIGIGKPVRRHHREVAGRQHRQVEARAAGLHLQARVLAGVAQRDVGAFGQLADDLVEGVGRRGDLAGALHLGRGCVGDLHVEVGGREGDLARRWPTAGRSRGSGWCCAARRRSARAPAPSAAPPARSSASFQVRSVAAAQVPPARGSVMGRGRLDETAARRKGYPPRPRQALVSTDGAGRVAGGGVGVLGDRVGGLGAGRSRARRRSPWPGARMRPNSS